MADAPLYYAKYRKVFKRAVETTDDDGSRRITMGFLVCVIDDRLSDNAAEIVANLLSLGAEATSQRD